MPLNLRKFFQFRIRDLLILLLLIGGIGGWFLMYQQEHQREQAIVARVLGDRVRPSAFGSSEVRLYAVRFMDDSIPNWTSTQAVVYIDYTGPAFLKPFVLYWFPDQKTIFHRIVNFKFIGLPANEKNLQMLTQLTELKEVYFYGRTFESVQTAESIMAGWTVNPWEDVDPSPPPPVRVKDAWYRSCWLKPSSN